MADWGKMRELRDRQELTNKRIAELSGLPERTVARIMDGDTDNPGVDSVARIMSVMGGSIDRLAGLAPARDFDNEEPVDLSVLDAMQEQIRLQREKLDARAAQIEQQRETISQQHATIREQTARLEANQASIRHRDAIIAEKDQEIRNQRDSLRRQATRYTITIIILILGLIYLCWDGANPNKGIFQYGQIVPVNEGFVCPELDPSIRIIL